MAYIEAILREPQIFQSFQKRFQYLESSGAILARSTRHRFGKSRIPKKLSQNRSKSAQNCSKLLTSAQNCSKSLTSAQNCMKFALKLHISIMISTQYYNILAILRGIGANIQYQYLETAKTILCGVLTHTGTNTVPQHTATSAPLTRVVPRGIDKHTWQTLLSTKTKHPRCCHAGAVVRTGTRRGTGTNTVPQHTAISAPLTRVVPWGIDKQTRQTLLSIKAKHSRF